MLSDITAQAIELLICEFSKPENKSRLQKEIVEPILEPCVEYIGEKLYPYVIASAGVIVVMLLMMMLILFKIIIKTPSI